jgi:hypothetical protein
MEEQNKPQDIEFDFPKFLGIDIEEEDREVGIFGNQFIFVFEDKDKRQISVALDDENMYSLIEEIKKLKGGRLIR